MAALEQDDHGLIVACPSCQQRNRLRYERLGQSVRCAQCKHELSMPAVPLDVASTSDFDQLLNRSSVPLAVDFWAPWCAPCRMVAPELAKVAARSAGRFMILKVNTDVLDDLGQRFGIQSIPTLAVFVGGREVARTAGARPASEIEAFIVQSAGTASRSVGL